MSINTINLFSASIQSEIPSTTDSDAVKNQISKFESGEFQYPTHIDHANHDNVHQNTHDNTPAHCNVNYSKLPYSKPSEEHDLHGNNSRLQNKIPVSMLDYPDN